MEIERRHAPVAPELLKYLAANPTPPDDGSGQQVHVHVHHHYAPAAPIPPGHIVHQGGQKSAAERVIPWLWVALLGCIVLTLCAAVLTLMAVIMVAVLAVVVVLGLVVAYIINSQAGAVEARAQATAMLKDGKARKRR